MSSPDWFCSTFPITTGAEVLHHLEVDRLVDMADLLVWILDPQEYADAAIHDRYRAHSPGTRTSC